MKKKRYSKETGTNTSDSMAVPFLCAGVHLGIPKIICMAAASSSALTPLVTLAFLIAPVASTVKDK
jgi:hypothetical protein